MVFVTAVIENFMLSGQDIVFGSEVLLQQTVKSV